MPYNETLAQRVREILQDRPGLVEKVMFGGVGFMLYGNMACGVYKDSLIIRIGPEKHESALARPHVRPFDITGRPMKGWIMVAPEGYQEAADLQNWIDQGVAFALSLPPK